jgi:hypothetical protein
VLKEQVMQASKLLQKFILKSCQIHKKRLEVLLTASETLVKHQKLSIAELGRGIDNKVKEKYNINRMNRLIGNEYLFAEALEIQRALTPIILGCKTRPIIVVDWSSATTAERFQLLRAGVPVGGRTLTIYEEVHPLKKYNSRKVHKKFLQNLSKVIPAGCIPIIVTDAGFSVPWFKEVLKLGWDYVGRVINNSYYQYEGETWQSIIPLLRYRKSRIKELGKVKLGKTNQFECYLQTYKAKHKGRVRKNAYGDKASRSVSKRCAKSARNAWVLVHSLGKGRMIAKRVVKIYTSRMQIEESFRDIKNPRYGFGLRYSRTLGIQRLTNLFLVGLIGTLMAWLIGLCAKSKELHYSLQTNTIKNRAVLSVFFIGCRIAKKGIHFLKSELLNAINFVQEHAYAY